LKGLIYMTDEMLMETAERACENAYAPYSQFKVGAALLTASGKVFMGCNVENASYGGCICAERTASVKAVSEGEKEFAAIAIANSGGGLTYPCGICRQFLYEFGGNDLRIILRDDEGNIVVHTLGELLPHGFKL